MAVIFPWFPSFLLLSFSVPLVAQSRSVVFKGQHTVSRAIPSPDLFAHYFARDELPLEILDLNPGLEKIEPSAETKGRYTGYLRGIEFPGLDSIFPAIFSLLLSAQRKFSK